MSQTKTLNIVPDDSLKRIHLSQGDLGRTLIFKLFDGSASYSPPAGATVKIVGTKPSGVGYSVNGTFSGNTVTIVTTSAMADEYGAVMSELVVTNQSETEIFKSANFLLMIEKDPHPAGTVDGESSVVVPTLSQLQSAIGDLTQLNTADKTSLVDAINEVTARQNADTTLNNAISAELIDIRVGADGNTYSSAGDAVRGQITDLKSGLNYYGYPILTLNWESGYLKSDGTVQTDSVYKTSTLIKIPAGHTLVFNSYASTSTYHFCNYDEDGTFESVGFGNTGLLGRNGIKIDAIEDRYVRICTNTTYIATSSVNAHFEKIPSEPTTLSDISNVGPASGVTFVSGYLSSSSHSRVDSDVYYCSSVIFLQKGQTIEFKASGSSGATLLMHTNRSSGYIANLLVGDGYYHRVTYTANDDMWVRICSRTASGGNYVTLDEFKDVKFYYKSLYYADEKLNGKKVVVIGDSLIYGNLLGNGVTWCQILANETGANVYNYGVNGNAISSVSGGTGTPMSERYSSITELSSADIVIVEGGANDYNNNCPIGTISDSVNSTFMGAINVLIDGIRATNPTAQLLFMTTYNRNSSANSGGLYYVDYVDAMLSACRAKSVPCYDNYSDSGITFLDSNLADWVDEGLYLGHTAQNNHISPAGYEWLYPKYKNWIDSQI